MAAPATTIKVKPYRHFLTSILHRGFVKAAFVALAVCYVDALFIGNKSSSEFDFVLLHALSDD